MRCRVSRMKRIAPFALVLLAACASSTDVIDNQVMNCDSGQDIEVRVGIGGDRTALHSMGGAEDQFEILVEVANNSHEDLTVKSVKVDQHTPDVADYRIDNSWRKFDQLIEEGKDHTFHLPTRGRVQRQAMRDLTGQGIELDVTVALTNGDSYRCQFSVGVPR